MKYTLPEAGPDRLGGIRVGDDFVIDETNGELNIKDMDTMRQQIESLPALVAAGKTLVASAITDRGVETAADASFAAMAGNIGRIKGSDMEKVTCLRAQIERPIERITIKEAIPVDDDAML